MTHSAYWVDFVTRCATR